MFDKIADMLSKECNNLGQGNSGSSKCPFNGGNMEIPSNLKDIMNAFESNLNLLNNLASNSTKKESDTLNSKNNQSSFKSDRPAPPPYPECPTYSHCPKVFSISKEPSLTPTLPVITISDCLSFIIKFLIYLLVFYLLFNFMSSLCCLDETVIKSEINSCSHCPFISGISGNTISDEELMENICHIVNQPNDHKKIIIKNSKQKNKNCDDFITQSDIEYDAICFIKKFDKKSQKYLDTLQDNYNLSIYFILLQDSDTNKETLNQIKNLVDSNNKHKLDIIENKPLDKKEDYHINLLPYLKHASFIINLELFDTHLLDSIIKLCIVSETPFLFYYQNQSQNQNTKYQKYEELKWGHFYNENNHQEKIKNFMENYCNFYK